MTQDEIIEMAQECRLIGMRPHLDGIYVGSLVAFAKLVEEKALAQPEQKYRRGDRLVCLETDEYCVIHIAGTDRQWVKFPDTHIGVYTNEQVDQLFEKLAKETDLSQPEQEPVISKWVLREVYFDEDGESVMHRSPPQPEQIQPSADSNTHQPEELKALDEQEPVAWRNAAIRVGEDLSSVGPDGYYDMTAQQWLDWAIEQEPRGKNSLAQPNEFNPDWDAMAVMVEEQQRMAKRIAELERENFAWRTKLGVRGYELQISPPQRTWVWLTKVERIDLLESTHPNNRWSLLALCEALLKEKNT